MPVLLRAAIWNVMTEIGSGASDPRDLLNMTSLLSWQDKLTLLRKVVGIADLAIPTPTGLPHGTHALRVFLAPEYLFSETCNRHVVNYETRGHLVEGLKTLSADFPDLLLIPGTVSYFKPLVDNKLEKARLKADPTHIARTVKYQGLYTVGAEKKTYLAHNTAYAFYGGQQVFKYRKMLNCGELNTQDSKAAKVMIFAVGNQLGTFDFNQIGTTVKIGLEICADHDDGQLRKGGAANLDLQLVLAASTAMKKTNAVLRTGGVLLHCNAGDTSTDGNRRAWQNVAGTLTDIRTMGGGAPPGPERIDPTARPELSSLSNKTAKFDRAFEKVQTKVVVKAMGKGPNTTNYVQQKVTAYAQTRGGTVHFYEATIP
jgi:hypothetical protein